MLEKCSGQNFEKCSSAKVFLPKCSKSALGKIPKSAKVQKCSCQSARKVLPQFLQKCSKSALENLSKVLEKCFKSALKLLRGFRPKCSKSARKVLQKCSKSTFGALFEHFGRNHRSTFGSTFGSTLASLPRALFEHFCRNSGSTLSRALWASSAFRHQLRALF